jgi:hypothetical protein
VVSGEEGWVWSDKLGEYMFYEFSASMFDSYSSFGRVVTVWEECDVYSCGSWGIGSYWDDAEAYPRVPDGEAGVCVSGAACKIIEAN